MPPVQNAIRWLIDIVGKFPLAVRPGLLIALTLLIGWILIRRVGPAWRLCVRSACAVTDLSIGLVLLAEYHWTQHRRRQDKPAAEAAITGGKVAERILDYAANAYDSLKPVAAKGRWRTPIIWGLIFCGASILLYQLGLHNPAKAPSQLAAHVWQYWTWLAHWARRD